VKVLLILPAKDEAANLPPLLASIERLRSERQLDLHVLVVDDGSTDDTAAVAASLATDHPYLALRQHPRNLGLGAAVRTGLHYAQANAFDAAALMDADLSQDPADLPRLLAALATGADLVIGSRYVAGGGMEGVPAWRRAISIAGNAVGRHALGVPVRDMTSGYRLFRVGTLDRFQLEEAGYGIQLEAVVKAHLAGLRLTEVPIVLRLRRHGASKLLYNAAFWRRYVDLFRRAWGWTHGAEGRRRRPQRGERQDLAELQGQAEGQRDGRGDSSGGQYG
jgi:dolichol-phosphate mannosyltransferase